MTLPHHLECHKKYSTKTKTPANIRGFVNFKTKVLNLKDLLQPLVPHATPHL